MADPVVEMIGNRIKCTISSGNQSKVVYIPLPNVVDERINHKLYYNGNPKTSYHVGDTLDVQNLSFYVLNSEDVILEITDPMENLQFDADLSTVGAKNLVITYRAQCTIPIEVLEKEDVLQSIRISTLPMKKEYKVGESLDLSGMEVRAMYESGKEVIISNDALQIEGFDSSSVISEQEIRVIYQKDGLSYVSVFTISIIPSSETIEKLSITSIEAMVYDTNYYLHEKFIKTDIDIVGIQQDGSRVPISSKDCIFSGFDSSIVREGEEIQVLYTNREGQELTTSFQISVLDRRSDLIGFRMDKKPSKVLYTMEDKKIDLTDGKFSARYLIGEKDTKWIPLQKRYLSGTMTKNTEDGKDSYITIKYEGFSVSYPITIIDTEE